MNIIRGLSHLETFEKGCVLTIGNFDGLHCGHRKVINKLAECGKTLNLPVVVMIFEPQPLEYFLHDNAPSRLSTLREKALSFSKLPIHSLLIVKFNRYFANMEADYFINEILINKLNIKHLVVGDDFHFGKARRGNFALLQEKSKQLGFTVQSTQSYLSSGLRVSSTLIRDALDTGNLMQAKKLLGHDYSVCGRVAHGDKRGRTLGYPTANIRMFRHNTPVNGVFAVIMAIDGKLFEGVANVGTRPTVDGSDKVVLETHLFNFNKDIYGKYVEVYFKHKIRNECCFASIEQLQAQIHKDVSLAKAFFTKK